jgi:hypothetical protein
MGTAEGRNGEAVRDAAAVRDALIDKGWLLEDDLKYYEANGGVHDEAAWATRVEPALRFLFPA